MVFDLSAGLYWRPEEGGLLFGMSNPDEPPGENRSVDQDYLATMRARLSALVPVTAGLGLRRVWAATIDYTPDHLPIIGPALGPDGAAGRGDRGQRGRRGHDVGPRRSPGPRPTWPSPAPATWWTPPNSGLDRFDEQRPQQARRRPDRPAVPGDGARPGAGQADHP